MYYVLNKSLVKLGFFAHLLCNGKRMISYFYMTFAKLNKLKPGDKVAILSPSFAAPGMFPAVYELGLTRLRDNFGLEPVEFPTTRKLGASKEERMADLVSAFENPEIKAIITTIGGDDQVTYVKNLLPEAFVKNPKPFFGFSDNTHFMNFLWQNGIPSYYGGSIMTQYAMQGKMNDFTVEFIEKALFEEGEFELRASEQYNDIGLNWNDPETLKQERLYEENDGWYWDGEASAEGLTWGGCVESIDEILRHGIKLPTLEEFENVVLIMETSEEIPSAGYVVRVFRALGERGILAKVKGVLIGRPKAWEFDKQNNTEQKKKYREDQRAKILKVVRQYHPTAPVVQNLDFGHTEPQIPMPYGKKVRIDTVNKKIFAEF